MPGVEKTGRLSRIRQNFPSTLTDLNARLAALWPDLRLQVEEIPRSATCQNKPRRIAVGQQEGRMPAPVQPAQQPRPRAFTWTIPAALAVLLVAGAVGSLAKGLVPADLIGADGMAATVVAR
jgi:hypothetical protein